jgi:hypothetical protein
MLISHQVFTALQDAQFAPRGLIPVNLKGFDEGHQALPLTFDDVGPLVTELLAAE